MLKKASPSSSPKDPSSPTVDDASEVDALYRAMYMAREYRIIASLTDELQGIVVAPFSGVDCTSTTAVWHGIIFVRAKSSPWYEGAFPFRIRFPTKYPFECPIAIFEEPLSSNNLLVDGNIVPFESEYVALSPAKVSICVRLLKFIRRLFLRKAGEMTSEMLEWARKDVMQASIFRIDPRGTQYQRLTDPSILGAMVQRYEQRSNSKTAGVISSEGIGGSPISQEGSSARDAASPSSAKSPPRDAPKDATPPASTYRQCFDQWFGQLFNSRILPFFEPHALR